MRRSVLAFLLLGLGGCASHASSPGDLVVTPGRAMSESPARVDLCPEPRAKAGILPDAVGGARFLCAPTPGGAWAARIDPPAGAAPDLAVVVVHADAHGQRT